MTDAAVSRVAPDVSQAQDVLAMTLGVMQTHVLRVAAELELADLLADGPKPATVLAEQTDTDPAALTRLLRVLTHLGLFEETTTGTFAVTARGALLQSGAASSVRAYASLMGLECFARSWQDLLSSVRTGKSAFQKIHGTGVYEYFRDNPRDGAVMNQAMSDLSSQESTAIAQAYDFGGYQRVVDIGGGRGALLAAILATFPGVTGTLFDLPHVVNESGPFLDTYRAAGRCDVVGGDFTDTVPEGGDLYILKRILIDHTDAKARALLTRIHAAMAPGGRLLVADPGVDTLYGRGLDVFMLMVFGSQLRSDSELDALFAQSGFVRTRSLPTTSAIHLVEAAAA